MWFRTICGFPRFAVQLWLTNKKFFEKLIFFQACVLQKTKLPKKLWQSFLAHCKKLVGLKHAPKTSSIHHPTQLGSREPQNPAIPREPGEEKGGGVVHPEVVGLSTRSAGWSRVLWPGVLDSPSRGAGKVGFSYPGWWCYRGFHAEVLGFWDFSPQVWKI